MKLYDEIISDILSYLEREKCVDLPIEDPLGRVWPDEGKSMMILQRDTAYELGGQGLPAVGSTILTTDCSLVPRDEITLVGNDLGEIEKDNSYARIALVRVKEDCIGTGNKLYNTIQNIGYFRYHIYPRGFMLRVSSSLDRESVRIGKDALSDGLNFTAVGNVMLRAVKMHREVEAARIIFITARDADYGRLKNDQKRAREITSTIDHMLKDVNMDCGSCGLQEICDEVEGLREMHFGLSEGHNK